MGLITEMFVSLRKKFSKKKVRHFQEVNMKPENHIKYSTFISNINSSVIPKPDEVILEENSELKSK